MSNVILPERPAFRVAFHFYSLGSGGVEKMRIILARELLARGIAVDFVLNRRAGEYIDQVPDAVRVFELGSRTATSVFPLRRYLRQQRPDALVASLGPQNIAAILAARTSGVRVRVYATLHNALTIQSSRSTWQMKLVPALYGMVLPKADGVIAVSGGVAADLQQTIKINPALVHTIYNPAYPEDIETRLAEPFKSDVFDGPEPTLLSVGRLVPQKDYGTLLEALALMNATRPVRLAILGVGPLQQELQEKARSLGIEDRVAFLGFHPNPLLFMQRASAVVMSSIFEGFGNVLVEALACGTPVVSTNCNYGPSEILADGKFGPLARVADAEDLARAVVRALDTPLPAEVLQQRARDFDVSSTVDKYLRLVSAPAAGKA